MLIPRSVESNKYPLFIRNNDVVKKFDQKKYFPLIGLKNYSDNLERYTKSARQSGLLDLIKEIKSDLNFCSKNIPVNYNDDSKIDYTKRYVQTHLNTISGHMETNPDAFILNNQIVLPFTMIIFNKFFEKNSLLLTVLIYIKTYCDNISREQAGVGGNISINMARIFTWLNNLHIFDNKNLKIVFSSSGNRGQWDIATMSMRGIKSCQRWTGSYNKCLIGSMVDPYAGILYITNNKNTKYGSKMIRRSVVRFVLDKISYKKHLLIERVYPHDQYISDIMTIAIFKDFLIKKTNNKLPILYGMANDCFIPITEPVSELNNSAYCNKILSYRDSHIDYLNCSKYYKIAKC